MPPETTKKRLRALEKKSVEFFSPGLRRLYEHDSVHAAIAFNGEPLCKSILVPGKEVLTSRELFEALGDVRKRQLVMEEVMVLSLERDLLPQERRTGRTPSKADLFHSYRKQCRLLITQYSKGWFPRWIIEHYEQVNQPSFNYWGAFQESPKKVPLPSHP